MYVLVRPDLDRRVRGLVGQGAGREGQLGEVAEGGEADLGDALGAELGLVNQDFLDVGVRGLRPVGRERCHREGYPATEVEYWTRLGSTDD